MTPGTVIVPWPDEGTVTDARADALDFITSIARLCYLPLPEVITVCLTQPDAEAEQVISEAIAQCRRHGIRCNPLSDERQVGLEIPGVVAYKLVHLRDSWLNEREHGTETEGAAT